MAADFDEESQLANETVTRQASNPNVTVALVMAAVVALVLGLVWNTSSRKGGKPQNAGEESFATADCNPAFLSTSRRRSQKKINSSFLRLRWRRLERRRRRSSCRRQELRSSKRPWTTAKRADWRNWKGCVRRKRRSARRRWLPHAGRERPGRNGFGGWVRARNSGGKRGRRQPQVSEERRERRCSGARHEESSHGCARAAGLHDPRHIGNGDQFGFAGQCASDDDRRRLFLRRSARAHPQGDDADGRISLGPQSGPIAHLHRVDADAARRWRLADAGLVRNRQFGALRPDRRSGQAFPRQIRQCGAADDHGGRGAIRRAARTKQSKPNQQSELCFRSDDRDADPGCGGTSSKIRLRSTPAASARKRCRRASKKWPRKL